MHRSGRRRFLRDGLSLAGLGLLAGCGTLPIRMQQPAKTPRIGLLANFPSRQWDAFRAGLADLGYVEGQTIALEARWSEGINDRFPQLAAELVGLPVDAIVASSVAGVRSARDATATIPIVMAGATNDPVADGLVASLAQPGGNITGLTFNPPELHGKWAELLQQVAPGAARLAVLSPTPNLSRPLREAAAALGAELVPAVVERPEELDAAFGLIAAERADGLLVGPVPLYELHRTRILDFAAQRRLPAMYPFRVFVEEGGLLFYGPDQPDIFRRAATYVDKILKGAKPAELPIERPTKFHFVINLKAARALGLTIPQSVIAQATELIE